MINKNFQFNNYNLYIILTFSLWLITILLYFFFSEYIKAGSLNNGVKFGSDTKFYFRQANLIINGDVNIFDYKSKLGYILFLIPFIYFDIPLVSIVFFQLFLTAISALCLYKITSKFFSKKSGIICLSLFLLYFPLQIRNFYILTEMLFIDITIILTYLIVYFKKINLPLIVMLIIVLVSIRPNGIIYLFSILTSIFYFLIYYKRFFFISIYLVLILIFTLPLIHLLNSYLVDLNLINSISNKGIIWGWSFENNSICKTSCLSTEFINNNYKNNIFDIFKFISINFAEFIKIFILKIFWLLARVRPYYSDLHNYYLIFFNLFIYFGFIYGFIKRPRKNFAINVILTFVLYSMVLVGLTFADWSGRFSLYFLPLIMIFSSHGILNFLQLIFNSIVKKKIHF